MAFILKPSLRKETGLHSRRDPFYRRRRRHPLRHGTPRAGTPQAGLPVGFGPGVGAREERRPGREYRLPLLDHRRHTGMAANRDNAAECHDGKRPDEMGRTNPRRRRPTTPTPSSTHV